MPASLLSPMFSSLFPPEPPRRIRGGWRMQLRDTIARDRSRSPQVRPRAKSTGCRRLLESWSRGRISLRELWYLADGFNKDDVQIEVVTRLAGMGTRQGRGINLMSKMKKLLGGCSRLELITELPPGCGISHCITPTRIFRTIHQQNIVRFRRVFCAYKSSLQAFWAIFSCEVGRQHKHFHKWLRDRSPADLNTFTPVLLHDDAGQYTKQKSTSTLSWGPILSSGSELKTRYVHHAFAKPREGDEAVDASASWALFFSEMDTLAVGQFPDGSPVVLCPDAGYKWGCILLFGTQDCEQLGCYGLPSYMRGDEPCPVYKCNKTSHPYTDMRPNSDWRRLPRPTHADFMARLTVPHPIQDSHYVCMKFFRKDVMHIADHNGVTGTAIGSQITHLIFYEARLGRNQAARLHTINKKLKNSMMPALRILNIPS